VSVPGEFKLSGTGIDCRNAELSSPSSRSQLSAFTLVELATENGAPGAEKTGLALKVFVPVKVCGAASRATLVESRPSESVPHCTALASRSVRPKPTPANEPASTLPFTFTCPACAVPGDVGWSCTNWLTKRFCGAPVAGW